MIKFNFRKEKIVTSPQFYLFKEFVAIWKFDRSNEKLKANKLLYFIFLLCDISEDNPLRDVDSAKREEESLFRAYGNKKHKFTKRERELLEPAVKCYIRYNITAEERILELFDVKAKELRQVLEDTIPETCENIQSGVTSFVSNSSIITNALKELDFVKRQKIGVIAAIRKEAITNRVRGQVSLSPLSKGNIPLASEVELHNRFS